jgi:hypothetical protein
MIGVYNETSLSETTLAMSHSLMSAAVIRLEVSPDLGFPYTPSPLQFLRTAAAYFSTDRFDLPVSQLLISALITPP